MLKAPTESRARACAHRLRTLFRGSAGCSAACFEARDFVPRSGVKDRSLRGDGFAPASASSLLLDDSRLRSEALAQPRVMVSWIGKGSQGRCGFRSSLRRPCRRCGFAGLLSLPHRCFSLGFSLGLFPFDRPFRSTIKTASIDSHRDLASKRSALARARRSRLAASAWCR